MIDFCLIYVLYPLFIIGLIPVSIVFVVVSLFELVLLRNIKFYKNNFFLMK
jgi:hypothetical protein